MSETLHPLEAIRLRHYWTYKQLGDEIKRVSGFYRNQDCWRRICLRETRRPNGLTAHAMTMFMASVVAPSPNGKKTKKVA